MRGFLAAGFAILAFAAVLALGAIAMAEDELAVFAIVVAALGLGSVFAGLATRASHGAEDHASGVRIP